MRHEQWQWRGMRAPEPHLDFVQHDRARRRARRGRGLTGAEEVWQNRRRSFVQSIPIDPREHLVLRAATHGGAAGPRVTLLRISAEPRDGSTL